MKTARIGDWQQTFTGRMFWPCDPRVENVCIEDIAHHLALMCRFGGACRVHYSVAEHSVRVAELVWVRTNGDREASLAGLLHDASEAYLVDIPRPRKRQPDMDGYRVSEDHITRVIEAWARLPRGICDTHVIKAADKTLLMTEARDLLAPAPAPWGHAQGVPAKPLDEVIRPWSPEVAELAFIVAFGRFGGGRG